MIAVSRLTALLTRKQRPYHVRIGNESSLRDLETAPAIMVGYSLHELERDQQQVRYFIDVSRKPIGITHNGALTPCSLPNLPVDPYQRGLRHRLARISP